LFSLSLLLGEPFHRAGLGHDLNRLRLAALGGGFCPAVQLIYTFALHPLDEQGGARPGLPHRHTGAGMSRTIQDATACREALARLPELDLGELRQPWRALYKTKASPHLSRELLLRAVAYRMQELALGGLRPEWKFAEQLKQGGATRIRSCPELKLGTGLVRELQGRTYGVLVLDDGFSWQGAHYSGVLA